MIQTLKPYSSKTDEIMSRYRPIAPKPQLPLNTTNNHGNDGGPLVPEKFRQSPYLRAIWSHLQARPTRTRKRGRSAAIPTMLRKQHHHKMDRFGPGPGPGPAFIAANTPYPVTLPLLSCGGGGERKGIDLNMAADVEERDLLLQLQIPSTNVVISPRPVRPVGSSISVVGSIWEETGAHVAEMAWPEEAEAAVEAELLPAVISDRSNKVRLANSAYKELVGQPECPWLGSMVSSSGKRINGEVVLHFPDPGVLPVSRNGFSCWVRIEWESEGMKKSVNALSEVVRLVCESKDYLFSWRFHIKEVSP